MQTLDPMDTRSITTEELLRIIGHLKAVRGPFDALVPSAEPDPSWNITLYLVEAHLRGEKVVMTSLSAVAGVPHATAIRRIERMIEEGQILRVSKGPGRSTSYLEPSPDLFAALLAFAERVKSVLAETFGLRGEENVDDFYLGAGDFAGVIQPPVPLSAGLADHRRELRFLLYDDNYFAAMRNLWSDYRSKLASRRSFTLLPQEALYQTLKADLARPVGQFEVVAIDLPWVGEMVAEDVLRPLDSYIAAHKLNPSDFHPEIWSAGARNGRQYGIPIFVTTEILAARTDLFAEKSLRYPRNFDEVVDAARQLNEPARGRHGIAWNGADGIAIGQTFMFLLGCCGTSVLVGQDGQRPPPPSRIGGAMLHPNIDSAKGLEVLDYLHRLIPYSPPGILAMEWNGRIAAFLRGEVAMAYCWSTGAARFETDVTSVVKRKVAYLPQPKGRGGLSANPIGGFVLSIPRNIPDEMAELAFQGIAWMASPEAMKAHVTGGYPVAPRFSVAADPEAMASSPLVRFLDSLAQRRLLCSWQRPSIPEYARMEVTVGRYVHRAMTGEMTDRAALSAAQAEVEAQLLVGREARMPRADAPVASRTSPKAM